MRSYDVWIWLKWVAMASAEKDRKVAIELEYLRDLKIYSKLVLE